MSTDAVKIIDVNAVQALQLRDQLVESGLIQHQDFEFAYYQAVYESFGPATQPRYVEFRFQDPTIATYYRIKWSRAREHN